MADYTEPTWPAESQEIKQEGPSTCFKRDPYLLTGLFIQFSRSHFYEADNILNDHLKGYLWSDSPDTRVQIEPSYKWDPVNVQQRPAIFIKREDVSVKSTFSLGHGKHTSHVNLNGSHTGVDNTVFIEGAHSILCVGGTAAEAENLGWEVLLKYLLYKEVLKKEANLGTLIVSGMSPANKVDENKENWMTQIKLSWAYALDWTLFQEAPILKKVAFDAAL